jgi:hypothetical protein
MRTGALLLTAALALTGARCMSPGPRRFNADEQAEIERAIAKIRFPTTHEKFWSRMPFPKSEFKPKGKGLTTGTMWEQYLLDDGRFLNLRTLADDRINLELWIDGAYTITIPGHPFDEP